MRTILLSLLGGATLLLSGCADGPCHRHPDITTLGRGQFVKLLTITADVDGSGRIIFTRENVHYAHNFWGPPKDVTLNGVLWNDLTNTPAGWSAFSDGLDLKRAHILHREGRDVIALEPTGEGFDLYLCDSPNGDAEYSVTIAIPKKH